MVKSGDASFLISLEDSWFELIPAGFCKESHSRYIGYTWFVGTQPRSASNVLIVDDEESQRVPLATLVESWGFTVETAADGLEALEKLAGFPANVIITDLMMPRMDGFELMQRLG
ncbi:MAG: response regulator, partial [Bryobacteraceae bacterium]